MFKKVSFSSKKVHSIQKKFFLRNMLQFSEKGALSEFEVISSLKSFFFFDKVTVYFGDLRCSSSVGDGRWTQMMKPTPRRRELHSQTLGLYAST